MISRILDNYYTKKVIDLIYEIIALNFLGLNIKTNIKDNLVTIMIKKYKYNNKEYVNIFSFQKYDSFRVFIEFITEKRNIFKRVEEYLAKNHD